MQKTTIGLAGVIAVANMPGGRHHVTNLVLRIEGDRATGRAAWMHRARTPKAA